MTATAVAVADLGQDGSGLVWTTTSVKTTVAVRTAVAVELASIKIAAAVRTAVAVEVGPRALHPRTVRLSQVLLVTARCRPTKSIMTARTGKNVFKGERQGTLLSPKLREHQGSLAIEAHYLTIAAMWAMSAFSSEIGV